MPKWPWWIENAWLKSYGKPLNWPVPEIYTQDGRNADAWYVMSRYSVDRIGAPMYFAGVITQALSCESCNVMGNTPSQGWSQLMSRLDADGRVRLPEPIPDVTDITWLTREVCFDC